MGSDCGCNKTKNCGCKLGCSCKSEGKLYKDMADKFWETY